MYRTSWNDLQQSRESPGNLWASNPRLTFVLQARCEERGFHLRLIFSQLRVTKLPLKREQSRSSAKSSWTETSCTNSATYRGCHIHRKKKIQCGLIHSGGPGNAFLSCSYEMSCCHSRLLCPEMTQPVHVLCSGFRAHLWSNTGNGNLGMLGNLHFHIIRLILASQSNPRKSKKEKLKIKISLKTSLESSVLCRQTLQGFSLSSVKVSLKTVRK